METPTNSHNDAICRARVHEDARLHKRVEDDPSPAKSVGRSLANATIGAAFQIFNALVESSLGTKPEWWSWSAMEAWLSPAVRHARAEDRGAVLAAAVAVLRGVGGRLVAVDQRHALPSTSKRGSNSFVAT